VAPRLTHRRRTFPYLDHCRRAVPHFVPSSPSAQPSLSASQRVVTRGVTQSTEPPACHDESDAADSITPGFGLGSPPWPRIHADLRGGTFGQVRTVTVEEARELLSEGGAALAAGVLFAPNLAPFPRCRRDTHPESRLWVRIRSYPPSPCPTRLPCHFYVTP
jgi:hypothetical protein